MKEYRIKEYRWASTIQVKEEIKLFGFVIHNYWVDIKSYFSLHEAYKELCKLIEKEEKEPFPLYHSYHDLRQAELLGKINNKVI